MPPMTPPTPSVMRPASSIKMSLCMRLNWAITRLRTNDAVASGPRPEFNVNPPGVGKSRNLIAEFISNSSRDALLNSVPVTVSELLRIADHLEPKDRELVRRAYERAATAHH